MTKRFTDEELRRKKAEYFKKYYMTKKDDIATMRKARYQNDPEHRRQIALSNLKQYRKRIAVKDVDSDSSTGSVQFYDALGNQLFTINDAARSIGKAAFTMRKYHEAGILPEPAREPSRQWRMYTQDQIAWMKHIFRMCTDITKNYTDLHCVRMKIKNVWDKPFDLSLI